jgi:uncharacterized membrane protein (UPF0182 family)
MGTYRFEPPRRQSSARPWLIVAIFAILLLLAAVRSTATYVIEYQWWKELGQVETWLAMITYATLPAVAAAIIAFVVLWVAHGRGVRNAGVRLRDYPLYRTISTIALLLIGVVVAAAAIDGWTLVRYFGSRTVPAGEWRDSVFGNSLSFYLFDLPFYSILLGYVLAITIVAMLIYFIASRVWQLRDRFPEIRDTGTIDLSGFSLGSSLDSKFLRIGLAIALIAIAVRFFLGRYQMIWNDHGFMVGVDYVDMHVRLPLQWLMIAALILCAFFVLMRRWAWMLILVPVVLLFGVLPALVGSLYVRPNEISLQRPFIEEHINATRAAYGFTSKLKEVDFNARQDSPINPANHQALIENVRLWEWRAFHDTITQIQALRPYYRFFDSDVDRYTIDGRYLQVLLSPRELDINQLAEARARWVNPHFIYTHGYGLVLSEVARITTEGLPRLLVQDAPPQIATPSLKITRPQIYYGEVVHEPVFVRTAQPEFSYPSGDENVFSRYEGTGGFPISSYPMRLAAALREGDFNILLTTYLTPESRMMIRRDVRERLNHVADFLDWDPDPYLVITEDGRLVWTVDAYTTSAAHPYSRMVSVPGIGRINYMRNSVKATVDAYDGTTTLYVFDEADPIIAAYRHLFPRLFRSKSEMPADLRAHTRYPETIFRVQAEMYRTFHMRDPQAFYNREDLWDLARYTPSQGTAPNPVTPTYIIAELPGVGRPEFLLMTTFTPRAKDNLIGLMLARNDGEHLGELVVLQLSKQELIFGPMQISARINQDQIIAKDLNLWNQQGSQVLRAQTLVLPVQDTFLYIEPIYIQATEARMPQLRKVVVSAGNRLIYEDTYEQAVERIGGGGMPALRADTAVAQSGSPTAAAQSGAPPLPPSAVPAIDRRMETMRNHLRRYRELVGQGRWSEAGRELEALEAELK